MAARFEVVSGLVAAFRICFAASSSRQLSRRTSSAGARCPVLPRVVIASAATARLKDRRSLLRRAVGSGRRGIPMSNLRRVSRAQNGGERRPALLGLAPRVRARLATSLAPIAAIRGDASLLFLGGKGPPKKFGKKQLTLWCFIAGRNFFVSD